MGDFSNSSGDMFYKNEMRIRNRVCISLYVCPFMYVLYVCTLCISLYVYLFMYISLCMYFMYVLCVCTLCMHFMYALYVCTLCMYFMYVHLCMLTFII